MSVDTDLTGPDEAVGRGPIGATSRVVRGGRGRWLATWGPPAAVFVASIGVWYGVSYLLLDPRRRFLVPPPHDVIRISFLDPYNLRELLDSSRDRPSRRHRPGWPSSACSSPSCSGWPSPWS